jgi:hypothetical protein
MAGSLSKTLDRAGMSTQDAAALLGVDLRTIEQWDANGHIRDADAAVLAPAIGVHPDYLRRGPELVLDALCEEGV